MKHVLLMISIVMGQSVLADEDLDKLLDKLGKQKSDSSLSGLSKGIPKDVVEKIKLRALSRVKLAESASLRRIRLQEPEPALGRLIYKDDFESYKEGDSPKHWPAKTCKVVQAKTPGNQTKVLRFSPAKPYATHCYMDPEIFATNFRLKFDFLCGESGELTWLTRLHGARGHSLWSNENYYQTGFYTMEGKPLAFSTRHLWVGGGYPFVNAPQPGVTTPQPSHVTAWHTAEIVMDDDRLIFRLNGVRLLDGHYPILMARTRMDVKYGFGLVARDSYSSTPRQAYVFNDWLDNIEIYDLGTPVRERHWPRRLHVAPWGDDANTGTDPAHPWKTLGKAFSQMRQGDHLTLQEGTYEGDVNWSKPQLCDFPKAGATLSDYPTVISATPHEKVTIKGKWQLAQPGWMRVEDLTFAGNEAGLSIEAAGKPTITLKRLAFRDRSRGLVLKMDETVKVICGRSLFLDDTDTLQIEGEGKVTFARSVFSSQPANSQAKFVQCTLIGPATKRSGSTDINCLSFNSMAEAAKMLQNPFGGRFDPKLNADFIDAGKPLPVGLNLPDWANMQVVNQPDLGAFEYFPPAEVEVNLPPSTKDILTGKQIVMPLNKRAETLKKHIGQLRPGMTLRVGPGLWSESGLALSDLRGEVYAPIHIESSKGLGATIHGSVRFTNCDQLHLKGFRIAGFEGTKPFKVSEGLSWSGCGRTFVQDCEITAFGHAGVSGNEQGVTLLQNWIHHNGTSGLNHGIYWAGEGPSWVIGNTFYGNAGWGFHNHQGAYDGWQGWKHNVHHNLFIGPGGAMVTTGSRGRYFNNTVIRASNAAFWFYNDGHRDNQIANNIIVESANSIHTRGGNTFTHNLTFGTIDTFLGVASLNKDPLFIDSKKHDYRLKPDSPALKAGKPVGLDDNLHPTLGAYDGNNQWAPPKPLPRYTPVALKKENQKLDKLEPKLPNLKND